jgi:nicotinamidase-related amidase
VPACTLSLLRQLTEREEMKNCALLVIDMQNAYFTNKELADRKNELIHRCNELTQAAKAEGIPVFNIYTAHSRSKSTWTLNMLDDRQGYLFAGDDDARTLDGLHLDNTITVCKTRDSAFCDTTLEQQLRTLGVSRLVLCGVSTHTCVAQTAADAYAANFRTILAADAIASHDPDYHEMSLDMLQKEYRQRRASNDSIRKLFDRV